MDDDERDEYGAEDYYVEGGDEEIVDLGEDIQPFSMSFKPKGAPANLFFSVPEKTKEKHDNCYLEGSTDSKSKQ